jgi:hypothetical protein
VHVLHRRQSAADVEELADALLGAIAHRPADERAVLPGDAAAERECGEELLRQLAVGGEIVRAAEPGAGMAGLRLFMAR